MDKVFIFDLPRIKPDVLEGIQNGTITIRDGVAYWNKLTKQPGIAQHLPLKEVMFDPNQVTELQSLMKAAHASQMAAIGISTGIIVGALVVQTAYLSKKLDKLQQTVDLISQDINSQNVIFFIEKMSEYFGIVESTRVLLLDKALVEETADIANSFIVNLSIKRNELMSLVDNLVSFADEVTDRHLNQMLDFITLMLDLIPKAIFIESQLCDRYGKFKLAEHLMVENAHRYRQSLSHYRAWCNQKAKKAISGESDLEAMAFNEKQEDLKLLFNSEINQSLLEQLESPNLQLAS